MYLISSEKAIGPGHLLGVYERKIFLCENYSLSVSYVKDLGIGPTHLLFIFLISTSCITIVGIYISMDPQAQKGLLEESHVTPRISLNLKVQTGRC